LVRSYIGVMALLGLIVVLLRAIKNGAGFESTMTTALLSMALLGLVGMIVATVADQTVSESVRSKIEAELGVAFDNENETTESAQT